MRSYQSSKTAKILEVTLFTGHSYKLTQVGKH